MKGMIKAYSASVNSGVAQGINGHNYIFSILQWPPGPMPVNGQYVTLDTDQERVIRIQPVAA